MNISAKRLKEIQNIPDSAIDTSDIPELDDNFWSNVKIVKPITKKAISMISTDITSGLENGDRLTLKEFQRRYEAMSHLKKAELIEGVVYISSPVRAKSHAKPHAHIMTWLGTYEAKTSGVEVLDNVTVRIDADNELQPDALLRVKEGGFSRITEDDYVEAAPELIVEIASSSVSYDLHDKLKVYRRNQVPEYLIWRVYERQFDWFRLIEGEYIQLETNAEGIICSQVFPGLWLDKVALASGDMTKVLTILEKGLASK